MSESVNYQQIHAYMLRKTQQYYRDPPAELVDAVIRQQESRGVSLSREEAKAQVSLIDIQRLIRREMTEKWPEFMSHIPQNPLQDK